MPISRRRFTFGFGLAAVGLAAPALVSCGGDDDADEAENPADAAATSGSPAVTGAASSATRGPSKGELRVASSSVSTGSLDGDDGTSHFSIITSGAGETLMRFGANTQPEPWMAKELVRIDDLTWKVTLRDDLTFWDGTKVDAEAVKSSFARTLQKVGSAATLIPKESVFTAEGLDLSIKTPTPVPLMAKALATAEFNIKKVVGEKVIYSGPFQHVAFTAKESMTLESYPGYRGGPAAIKTIKQRAVADTDARVLALQAGDIDLAESLLPTHVATLKSAGYQVLTASQARQHLMILNNTKFPFDDVAVRRAVSLGIDREAIVKGIYDGVGAATYSIAPEGLNIPGVTKIQKYDQAEAKKALDAAGWAVGSGGTRSKDGKALTFTVNTYPGRADLEQFAVVIADQLKPLGIQMSIEKVTDITPVVNESTFQATMYSLGQAAFTDIGRMLSYLYTPSPTNKNRYNNTQVNDLYAEYLANAGSEKGLQALTKIQAIIAQDVPAVHIAVPAVIVAHSKAVKGLVLHPLDYYRYGPDISIS